jgi:D-3-phosphoglycerate dehydrogenase
MPKPKCVITADIVEPYLSKIKELCDVTICGWVKDGVFLPDEELIKILHDAEIFILEFEQIGANIINACPNLKLIICARGNPINIDRASCTSKGIPLAYTPGRNANSVAEYTIGAMISLIRNISRSNREILNGRFLGEAKENIFDVDYRDDTVWSMGMPDQNPYTEYKGMEVFGKTFGMIGYGAISKRLSKILNAMGMKVITYDPYVSKELIDNDNVKIVSLERVLSESDILSINCKVTEETKGMIGKNEISLIKPSAYIINTARAVIIEQKALIDALIEKRIAGAVLDVFWEEPLPSNHPLLKMDNVLITPHIAGASIDVPVQHSLMVLEEVQNFINQKPPIRVFNREIYEA